MADNKVRTWDAKQLIVVFGAIKFTGFAEGTIVAIERNGEAFEKVRGADGGIDRVNKNANDFQITVTLKQTSPTNDLLTTALIADQAGNLGVFPIAIKDLGGTTLFASTQAWISKDPDDDFSDSMGSREWVFDTGVGAKITGSN